MKFKSCFNLENESLPKVIMFMSRRELKNLITEVPKFHCSTLLYFHILYYLKDKCCVI